MWSRHGTPLASLRSPVPSRLTKTRTRVSAVLRLTSALRIGFRRRSARRDARGSERFAQRLEQQVVLLLGSDRQPQAVAQQIVHSTDVLDQQPAAAQAALGALAVGHAYEHEIRTGGEDLDAGQLAQPPREPVAADPDARGLLVEHVEMLEREAGRRVGERVDVVRRTHLLELL